MARTIPSVLTVGVLVSVVAAAAGTAQAAPLRMACRELLQGEPVSPPILYEVVGRDLVRTSLEGRRVVISREGERYPLGVVHDGRGETSSYAEHALRGSVLTRTLYRRRPGTAPRRVSVERFDFAAGRYTSGTRQDDLCNPEPMR